MAMKCFVCGRKLNIFSDYKQIMVDGEKKEICAKCYREREKVEVDQLLQTSEGKQKVSMKGSTLISTGVLEIILSGFFILILNSGLLRLIAIGFFIVII